MVPSPGWIPSPIPLDPWSFQVILTPVLGRSSPECAHQHSAEDTREPPCMSGFSLCSHLLSGGVSCRISPPWCPLFSGLGLQLRGSAGLPLGPLPVPGNSLQVVNWSNRELTSQFPVPGDHFSIVLWPVSWKPFFHMFCTFGGCFMWESKSGPCYSTLFGSRSLGERFTGKDVDAVTSNKVLLTV